MFGLVSHCVVMRTVSLNLFFRGLLNVYSGILGVLKTAHNLKNKIFTGLQVTIIVVGVSRQFVKIMTARLT